MFLYPAFHSLAFLCSAAITCAAGWLFIRKAATWGFIDIPEDRKIHRIPTPRTGGLAMAAGGVLAWFVSMRLGWIARPSFPWQTVAAGVGFVLLGGFDDRFSFRPRGKFWVMLALAGLAAWPWAQRFQANGGQVDLSFSGLVHLPAPAAWLLLLGWFMALPNAVNIEDAINGYMGSFTLVMAAAAMLAGVPAAIPAGALVGFLVLNFPLGRHFMGDAGSFGCGFLIAELLLRAGGISEPFPALILTAPISLDVAMGILRRIRLGMGLFEADRSTLPHRLVGRFGGSHVLATLCLLFIALGFLALRHHPLPAVAFAAAYSGLLLWMNWPSLTGQEASKG